MSSATSAMSTTSRQPRGRPRTSVSQGSQSQVSSRSIRSNGPSGRALGGGANRVSRAHDVRHLLHGMHAHDVRAEQHRRGDGSGRRPVAVRRPRGRRWPPSGTTCAKGPRAADGPARRATRGRPAPRSCAPRAWRTRPRDRERLARARSPRQPPRRDARRARAPISRDNVVVLGLAVHLARAPAVVHQDHRGARRRPRRPPGAGSYLRALTSFTMRAPRSSAARATSALYVSIEIGMRHPPGQPFEARARCAGALRPPTPPPRRDASTRRRRRSRSAPASCMRAPPQRPARDPRNWPPSAKESGVTFRTPMRSVRSPSTSGPAGSGIESGDA